MTKDILLIGVSDEGLRVKAATGTVAGTNVIAKLVAAIGLPLNLLNKTVQDYFQDLSKGADAPLEPLEDDPNTGFPKLNLPAVFVPRLVDGMLDLPRRITIQVANGPRETWDDPPQWFIDGVKKMFPTEDFNPPVDQESINRMESQHSAGKNEFEEDIPAFKFVDDHHDLTGETAVTLFQSEVGGCAGGLDHWGFAQNKDGRDILISEPYGISLESISKLAKVIKIAGWTLRIVGVSAHYPSATIRIEIWPSNAEGVSHAA